MKGLKIQGMKFVKFRETLFGEIFEFVKPIRETKIVFLVFFKIFKKLKKYRHNQLDSLIIAVFMILEFSQILIRTLEKR